MYAKPFLNSTYHHF